MPADDDVKTRTNDRTCFRHGLTRSLAAMKRWSFRHALVLLLAVFVTAGIGLSFVHAAEMTAGMAVASDMRAPPHDGCKACPPDDSGKAMNCTVGCPVPAHAVLAQAEPIAIAEATASFTVLHPALYGMEPPPNAGPPRPTDIV
jgi:hypothetical protein